MKKTKVSRGNFTGIIGALLVLAVGLIITVDIPIIGWVVGPLLMLLALGRGAKRQRCGKCGSCKTIMPRA